MEGTDTILALFSKRVFGPIARGPLFSQPHLFYCWSFSEKGASLHWFLLRRIPFPKLQNSEAPKRGRKTGAARKNCKKSRQCFWHFWESAKVSHLRVLALSTPDIHSYEMAQMLPKISVRASGLSADECEHPFVWYFGAGWTFCRFLTFFALREGF